MCSVSSSNHIHYCNYIHVPDMMKGIMVAYHYTAYLGPIVGCLLYISNIICTSWLAVNKQIGLLILLYVYNIHYIMNCMCVCVSAGS